MKIGIISNVFKVYSSRRLIQEANKRRHRAVKLFPKEMFLTINKQPEGVYGKLPLDKLSVCIPRLGSRNWEFELMAVKHLENMGVPLVNSYRSIVTCKNKYLTNLALKKKKVPQPQAAIALSSKDMLKFVSKLDRPVVLKLLSGSFGLGVSKIHSKNEAEDLLGTFRSLNKALYIQEYIDHGGCDYRLFVIGGKVVFTLKRIAKKGEWKTNIALGGKCEIGKPSKKMKEYAIRAAEATKCDVAGVDMVIDPDGKAKVLEVNTFPYFHASETKCGQNIAKKIIDLAIRKAKR